MKLPCYILTLLFAYNVSAQTSDKFTKYGEVRVTSLASRFQVYQLLISLPDSYEKDSDRSYPVMYILDPEWNFGYVEQAYRDLSANKTIPEMILVGVGYGSSVPGKGNYRDRDMGPTTSGINYAEEFSSFFDTILIPYIDKSFRTKSERVIHGHSMGGLFSSYILFTKPQLFNYYLISSPSWWWRNKKFVFDIELTYAASHNQLNAHVYFSVGEDDGAAGMIKPLKKFVTVLRDRKYRGLTFVSHTYPGKDHLTVMDVAAYDGLKAVFQMKD